MTRLTRIRHDFARLTRGQQACLVGMIVAATSFVAVTVTLCITNPMVTEAQAKAICWVLLGHLAVFLVLGGIADLIDHRAARRPARPIRPVELTTAEQAIEDWWRTEMAATPLGWADARTDLPR